MSDILKGYKFRNIEESGKVFISDSFRNELMLKIESKVFLVPMNNKVILCRADECNPEIQVFSSIIDSEGKITLSDELMDKMGWKVKNTIESKRIDYDFGYLKKESMREHLPYYI